MEFIIINIIAFGLGWLIGKLTNRLKKGKKVRSHPSDHG